MDDARGTICVFTIEEDIGCGGGNPFSGRVLLMPVPGSAGDGTDVRAVRISETLGLIQSNERAQET